MDGAGSGQRSPVVLVIEDRGFSREYRPVFEYLAIRPERIRAVPELVAALDAGPPIAVIWHLESDLDQDQVARALADAARDVPLLIVGNDDATACASGICARNGATPAHLAAASCPRDVIEFLLRAGCQAGQLRVLAV
jgi:hypothetical protein